MGTPNILDLPGELIAHIFRHLNDDDFFATRQPNKQLERASFALFSRRFFRKKGYMTTTSSLNVLQLIADHEELRKYVQHVWFNPDCFTFWTPEFGPDDHKIDEYSRQRFLDEDEYEIWSKEDKARYEAYQACTEDHEAILFTEELPTRLALVFHKLPNLEVLGMRRSEDHNPWGCLKLLAAVGQDPRILGPIPSGPAYALSGPTYLFIAFIKAVASSNVKLERLYTDAIEIDNVKPEVLPPELLSRACDSILYLELNASKAWLNTKKDSNYSTLREASEYGNGLIKLLKATAQLRELGLMIFPDRKQSHLVPPTPRQPASWKGSYPYLVLEKLANSIDLKHLRRVKLEKFTTSAKILTAFLQSSQSGLESLKIRDVRLISQNAEDQRPWQSFLSFLRDDCSKLEYLFLYHLAYDHGGVRFVENLPPKPTPDPTVPRLATVASAGDFTDFENITIEVQGREAMVQKLKELTEQHWYGKHIFTYDMDEDLWHTDTSDEEW